MGVLVRMIVTKVENSLKMHSHFKGVPSIKSFYFIRFTVSTVAKVSDR